MRVPIVLLLAVALAGCADEAAEAEEPQEEAGVVTDPTDYSYLNDTDNPGWHAHNYWRGEDRLTVLDVQSGEFIASCSGCSNGMRVMHNQPESGDIVPQGAAHVNVTVSWTDTSIPEMDVWIKTAARNEPVKEGTVGNGGTLTFNSTNDDNDPPHHVLSLWSFAIHVPGAESEFEGSITLRAEAVRGLPIEPWPPHPDHWKGATEITLLDHTKENGLYLGTENPMGGSSYYCFNGCPGEHRVDDGVIVPPGTGAVEAVLTFDQAPPAGLVLSYHGADSREHQTIEPVEQDATVWTYRIPIQDTLPDSPYALQSLWTFRIGVDYGSPVEAWTGTYSLETTALHERVA